MSREPRKVTIPLRGFLYAISALFFCFIGIGVIGQIYLNSRINNAITNNNQKLCNFMDVTIAPGPGVPSPAPGSRGETIIIGIRQLEKDYKCK